MPIRPLYWPAHRKLFRRRSQGWRSLAGRALTTAAVATAIGLAGWWALR